MDDAITDLTMKSKHFSRDFELLTLELAGSDTEKLLVGVAVRIDSSENTPKKFGTAAPSGATAVPS